ncbi:MAG: FliG C-terminal domain-containing protein [Candidatus Marinimicrobia bacterium]|jgi:flagellar motor switch protein FliG|nr:FliG C-terminal domain-containing protein [Candidatus Neomarinimicrobiota bacterium]|tara:strand:- start:98 stop:1030 length:933 start_codon:yes stop_codon:yes gene_type:complete
MITDYNQLSGLQKVAILFSTLGESLALTLVKDLSKTDIRKIRSAIREMDDVAFSVKKRVMEDFYFNFVSEKFEEDDSDEPQKPFAFLSEITDEQLVALLSTEAPRVIAIILAQVPNERKTAVMARLEGDVRNAVLRNMGNLQDVPLQAIVNIATRLKKNSQVLPKTVEFSRGGGKEVADLLGEMTPEEEKQFLDALTVDDPELAEEVRKYHITFDAIFELFPDNIIRDLMNSVELDVVALALKGISEDISSRVIENLPQKKQAMYEPVEGAVSKREVDGARKSVVQAAKQMEKDGAYNLEDFVGGSEMVE